MKKRLALLLCLCGMSYQAHGVLITTSIGNYDVATVDGTFDSLAPLLRSQVWWHDEAIADEFAGLVGPALGLNSLNNGPGFAVCAEADCLFNALDTLTVGSKRWDDDFAAVVAFHSVPSSSFSWATATQAVRVPEPRLLALLIPGLIAMILLHRRDHRQPRGTPAGSH